MMINICKICLNFLHFMVTYVVFCKWFVKWCLKNTGLCSIISEVMYNLNGIRFYQYRYVLCMFVCLFIYCLIRLFYYFFLLRNSIFGYCSFLVVVFLLFNLLFYCVINKCIIENQMKSSSVVCDKNNHQLHPIF